MGVRSLLVIAAASVMLTGCAGYVDATGWTPEQVAAFQQQQAQRRANMAEATEALTQSGQVLNAQTQAAQASSYQAPVIGSYSQPSSTAIVYCHDLNDALVACKQIK